AASASCPSARSCARIFAATPKTRTCEVSDELVAERARRGGTRIYADDRIEVHWEPGLCIHVQNCVRGLPQVFDAESRPWIHVDAADADRIAETVATCPTGALHFRRLDGGAQEEGPEEAT